MLRVALSSLATVVAGAIFITAPLLTTTAKADDAAIFMQNFSGEWHGAGRLLVGPEAGKHFHCRLNGKPSRSQLTFKMRGKCWMGRLGAKVHATLRYSPEQGKFFGTFMDGSKDDGVDVIGERVGDSTGFVLRLSREMTKAVMIVEPLETGVLDVSVTLLDKENNREIPIAAMGFGRPEKVGLNDTAPNQVGPITTASKLQ